MQFCAGASSSHGSSLRKKTSGLYIMMSRQTFPSYDGGKNAVVAFLSLFLTVAIFSYRIIDEPKDAPSISARYSFIRSAC